jgi:hypothetical protein
MAGYTETKFVKQYEPGSQARVGLVNGRILDVVNGCYHDAGTRVILQGGLIESMPGLTGEPTAVKPDFSTGHWRKQMKLEHGTLLSRLGKSRSTGSNRRSSHAHLYSTQ